MTDRETVLADIDALYLGNLGTVETDLDLPTRGCNGSRIAWTTSDPGLIDTRGTVRRPTFGRGNRPVTLTAVFSYGNCSETREYPAQVLEEPPSSVPVGQEPVALSARAGETAHLPSFIAVGTDDGRTLSLGVDWDGGAEHVWDEPGLHAVGGTVREQGLRVRAEVRVEAAPGATEAAPGTEEGRPAGPRGTMVATGPVASSGTSELPHDQLKPVRSRLHGPSVFLDAQERMHAWLLRSSPDRMLYNFRRAAGLDARGALPLTGWDAPEGLLRGHTTGHYLSALAKCWRATGDGRIRDKARAMVDGLAECQSALEEHGCATGFLFAGDEGQFNELERGTPYPKIWAPYYTLHKILAGLLDAYELAGIEEALPVACGIGEWTDARLSRLTREHRQRMWGTYIAGEYGGMGEALVRLARLSDRPGFVTTAQLFDNDRLFVPLLQGADALDGMHANQHIPQAAGALELYRATGETRYLEVAERFWRAAAGHHAYAIGGVGESEMFHAPDAVAGLLTDKTCESCASYNMLKLTGALHVLSPRAVYMDYYERTLFSHTLATSSHAVDGGTTYFISLAPGARRTFDLGENSCCQGTGLEQPFMYADHIYHLRARGDGGGDAPVELLVDLFIPSETELADGLHVVQSVNEDQPGRIRLAVDASAPLRMLVRVPSWCAGGPRCRLDGDAIRPDREEGYLSLDLDTGSHLIDIEFPVRLRVERAPDDARLYTVFWGPYALAALSGATDRLCIPAAEALALGPDPARPMGFVHSRTGTPFIPFAHVDREAYQLYLMDAG